MQNFARTLPQLALLCLLAPSLRAQPAPPPDAPTPQIAEQSTDTPTTLFPHSDTAPWFISGQANIILQGHGPFHSPYSGPNSLLSRGEYKTSMVGTLFLGYELLRSPSHHLEALYDEESAGGRGISEALGLAGFTNLDVVRNPNLGSVPYTARVELHQTIGLSSKLIDSQRGPFNLATKVPERRIELRFGKMSLPDTFDQNSVGTDSHLQFLNWTVDNNGAWDYAADTRGYTYAAIAEYDDKLFSLRYALALMPTVANGIDLDWSVKRASGQNIEAELRPQLLTNRKSTLRVLSFVNHAHMGLYRDAIKAYLAGKTPKPEITSVEQNGAVKYGFAFNLEQQLTPSLTVYSRLGWNEGQHETWAYTEVDQSFSAGALLTGDRWSRPNDRVGLAFVSNAIKRDHQEYLSLGGQGFLLGDGHLSYAREDILEGFYTLHTWRGLSYALDLQYVDHPGYNQARGPVLVESLRMHVDF